MGALEQSGLHTIALACRAIFDGKTSGLGGGRIARLTDESLDSVAKQWANKSKRLEEAIKALTLLRRLFARCARSNDILLEQPSLLEPRIGLLKHYANRQAAHITMGHYLFDPVLDVIHVAAALVLIGAIIVEFDDPRHAENRYFDSVDEGAWQSAKRLFPHLPERVFNSFDIHQHATNMWKSPCTDGVEYIVNQLPAAIGY